MKIKEALRIVMTHLKRWANADKFYTHAKDMSMSIYRIENGEKREAIRDSNGNFVLGDPKFGSQKHTKAHQVLEADEKKAADLILNMGYSIRVSPLSSKAHHRLGLVRKNLFRDGTRLS